MGGGDFGRHEARERDLAPLEQEVAPTPKKRPKKKEEKGEQEVASMPKKRPRKKACCGGGGGGVAVGAGAGAGGGFAGAVPMPMDDEVVTKDEDGDGMAVRNVCWDRYM